MRHPIPIVIACAVLGLGGCGIPDDTGVTVVGPGPSTGIASGDNGTWRRPERTSSREPSQFIANFLGAAAGDYDTAADRVREFMTPAAREKFKPAGAPRVIRLTQDPLVNFGQRTVTLSYQLIGTLGKNGILEPAAEPAEGEYEIRLEDSTADGLFVAEAPDALLLSDTALNTNYVERTIYFWNNERTALVPDVRYMLQEVPDEQEPTIILGWLIAGPSRWLDDAVESLPQETATIGKVFAVDERLQINLNAQALPTEGAPEALERLRKQLQWSLRHLLARTPTLDLKIGHQETRQYSSNDYLPSNTAYQLGTKPERFVVYDGRVVRHADSLRQEDPVPAIPEAANKDVRTAALAASTTHTFAALVTGSGSGETLRVGGAPFNEQATLRPVTGLPGGAGHPIWAITPDKTIEGAVGLIIADGRLYSFSAEGGAARLVPWTGGSGRLSSISVAPDGHRVALVADGKLYRAALTISGDGVTLIDAERLQPGLTTVTAVGFSSESWLTVAGRRRDGRNAIMDVSIDGALQWQQRPSDIGNTVVTYLAVYPATPVTNEYHSSSVSFSTATGSWDAFSNPDTIDVADLANPPAEPPPGKIPLAPFYLN